MVKGTSGRVAFTVRLPEGLHQAFKVWCAQNGTDLQDGMTAAIEAFLGEGGRRSPHPASCPLAAAGPEEVKAARHFLAAWRAADAQARAALAGAADGVISAA
jgi:hypothetical protein